MSFILAMTKAASPKLRILNVWKAIRKRFVSQDMIEAEADLDLISTADPSQHLIWHCLQQLNTCSAGTALYILDCLCPDDFALVLDLLRLDLSDPHQHKRLSKKDIPLESDPNEHLLALLRAGTGIVPAKDYPHFWLELTKRWLLTSPVDPKYDLAHEAGTDMLCQKLRAELVERILRID